MDTPSSGLRVSLYSSLPFSLPSSLLSHPPSPPILPPPSSRRSMDNTAKLWDVETGAELCTLLGHTAEIVSLSFNQAGDKLITGSFDHTTKLWDVKSGCVSLALSLSLFALCVSLPSLALLHCFARALSLPFLLCFSLAPRRCKQVIKELDDEVHAAISCRALHDMIRLHTLRQLLLIIVCLHAMCHVLAYCFVHM